jgi:hypothetical protein
MSRETPVSLNVDAEALRPLVEAVVDAALQRLERARMALPPDRLAYSEAEASALIGLAQHQLRDERLRGRISASQIVGRRVRYTRQDLLDYLVRHRLDGAG